VLRVGVDSVALYPVWSREVGGGREGAGGGRSTDRAVGQHNLR
jgi:hypothetical protein